MVWSKVQIGPVLDQLQALQDVSQVQMEQWQCHLRTRTYTHIGALQLVKLRHVVEYLSDGQDEQSWCKGKKNLSSLPTNQQCAIAPAHEGEL